MISWQYEQLTVTSFRFYMKMKMKTCLTSLLLCGGWLSGQTASPPLPGSIIPDTMTFAMSTFATQQFPPADLIPDNALIPGLENRSYSDFPNEVVATVYHTPW